MINIFELHKILKLYYFFHVLQMCVCLNGNNRYCEKTDFQTFFISLCLNNTSVSGPGDSLLEIVCDQQDKNKLHETNFQAININFTDIKTINIKNCPIKARSFRMLHLQKLECLHFRTNLRKTFLQNNIFDGLCTLKRIELAKNNIKGIDPSAFECVVNVQHLDLSHNEIEFLSVKVFEHMKELNVLYLNDNSLHTLTGGIFKNLKSLTVLLLHSNLIYQLPDDIFDQQAALEILSLSNNKLENLNRHVFSKLKELTMLDISNNKLRNLTSIFHNNSQIWKLDISKNKGMSLNKDTFVGLCGLKELNLHECNLKSLPYGLFESTQAISNIVMYNNRLQLITSQTFGALKNLRILDLSFNDVTELNNRPFQFNRNLQVLRMFKNNLPVIKRGDFYGLISLITLDISSNFITNIDGNAFHSAPKLFSLNISHNFISSLDGSHPFGNSERLSEIDISYNRLTDIRITNWEQFLSLEEFWATNNEIKELFIPNSISQGPTIHLEENQIRRIHLSSRSSLNTDIHTFSTTTYFYLNGNPLECDCNMYDLYKYLTRNDLIPSIEFPDGLICQYPAEQKGRMINNLKPMDFLCDITSNCPKYCDCAYRIFDSVKIVNCSNRGYKNLPHKVPYNTSILNINRNNLISLSTLNSSIWENLTELHAADNEIMSAIFFLPKKLHFLSFSGNRLRILPDAIKTQIKNVKSFHITMAHNFWQCDCSILDFQKWLANHINQVNDITDIHCIFPNKTISFLPLIRMRERDLCPYFPYIHYTVFFGIMLLLASTVIFYYKHTLYIKSYLYSHCNKCYMLLCCGKPNTEDKLFDCFISYSSTDRDVTLAIIEELEKKPPYYKFCIHERNWIPGHCITKNIVESVQNSKKTLIIISEIFLKSNWFYLEFQAAYHQTLQDRNDRLIIILKGTLPDDVELDSDVKYVISSKTYLRWGKPFFWEKLRYAFHQQKIYSPYKRRIDFKKMHGCLGRKQNLLSQELVLNKEI